MADLPLPPLELADRVGELPPRDPWPEYLGAGEVLRDDLVAALPGGWSWEGRRVLDFGCGAGRVLRQFALLAPGAELHGCDLHAPSVDWINERLSPPLQAFVPVEGEPLPRPDGYFDLVYGVSVFTHLDAFNWAGWLLELHRVLRPGGLLLLSYLGESQAWRLAEPWSDERIGMNALWAGEKSASATLAAQLGRPAPDEVPSPLVFHSKWWIRAHWGRAFEILALEPEALRFGPGRAPGQALCVMRRREVSLSAEDLERPEPGEHRELTAALHHARQLYREAAEQRRLAKDLQAQVLRAAEAERRAAELNELYAASRSWRLTWPLREAAQRLRRRRG